MISIPLLLPFEKCKEASIVVQDYSPSPWEAEVGGSEFKVIFNYIAC